MNTTINELDRLIQEMLNDLVEAKKTIIGEFSGDMSEDRRKLQAEVNELAGKLSSHGVVLVVPNVLEDWDTD